MHLYKYVLQNSYIFGSFYTMNERKKKSCKKMIGNNWFTNKI